MRVVIDMQGSQSEFSGKRGVGRYTRELTKNLILCSKDEMEIFLALNGSLECGETMAYFEHIIDRDHIKVWNYYPETQPALMYDQDECQPAELFREWFLHQFNADVIWVPNYQEGALEANIATSAFLTRGNETVVSTLHDVTPLLFEEEYLRGDVRPWYMKKINYVKESDVILTVSEFSKSKITELMDADPAKIKVILNAYDRDMFFPDTEYENAENKEKYFLYAGGADEHKNLRTLFAAYAGLDDAVRKEYHLVLVGKEPYQMQEHLVKCAESFGISKEQAEFPGFVPDKKLRELMQRCTGFIFPAYAEGFGLPPLEAMACGAPALAADATSLKEIVTDKDAVFDPFDVRTLTNKLSRLITDKEFANRLISSGLERAKDFSWEKGGLALKELLLNLPAKKRGVTYSKADLCNDLYEIIDHNDYKYKAEVARSIESSTLFHEVKHIYIDTSAVVIEDYVSGIQRAVNGIIASLKQIPGRDGRFEVRAVYSCPEDDRFYYSAFNGKKYIRRKKERTKDIVEFHDGDIFLMPDLHTQNVISKQESLSALCMRGIKVITVLYDIIPMDYPGYFSKDFVSEYKSYLEAAARFSGIIGISRATLERYQRFCQSNDIEFPPYFISDYNYLGCDILKANPSLGMPEGAGEVLAGLGKNPTILMVGTMEPRKKHDQVLAAMDHLWKKGSGFNLVFVGRNGWQMDDFVEEIRNHPENGRHLFWLSGISDEYLEKVYEVSSGVIVASVDEGYGLPIIEAAQHGKPLLLRDIAVFRETAGDHARYFTGDSAEELGCCIENWIKDIQTGKSEDSSQIKYYTWKESTENLLRKIEPSIFETNGQDTMVEEHGNRYDSFQYLNFEEKFRGTREVIKARQKQYVKYFLQAENVLDIGCGRGEFLELLSENGVPAEGADLSRQNVDFCRKLGLKVFHADGIHYLQSRLQWGGIFSSQVIEHISFEEIFRLCVESYARLEEDGYLILETPNPTKVGMFTNTFYLDPTHNKPVHPGTMQYIFETIGFRDIQVIFTEESRYGYSIPHMKGEKIENLEEINYAFDVLNDMLFGSMDYAIIGKK